MSAKREHTDDDTPVDNAKKIKTQLDTFTYPKYFPQKQLRAYMDNLEPEKFDPKQYRRMLKNNSFTAGDNTAIRISESHIQLGVHDGRLVWMRHDGEKPEVFNHRKYKVIGDDITIRPLEDFYVNFFSLW